MATRSVTSRIEHLENSVGSLMEGMQTMMQRMDRIIKQQEEAVSKDTSEDEATPESERRTKGGKDFSDSSGFFAIKGRKLEIPSFEGKDPDGWILRVERYFSLNSKWL